MQPKRRTTHAKKERMRPPFLPNPRVQLLARQRRQTGSPAGAGWPAPVLALPLPRFVWPSQPPEMRLCIACKLPLPPGRDTRRPLACLPLPSRRSSPLIHTLTSTFSAWPLPACVPPPPMRSPGRSAYSSPAGHHGPACAPPQRHRGCGACTACPAPLRARPDPSHPLPNLIHTDRRTVPKGAYKTSFLPVILSS